MYIYIVEKTIENRGFTHGSSMVIIQLICNRYDILVGCLEHEFYDLPFSWE